MTLAGGEVLGKNAVVASTKAVAVNTTIVAPMHKKREVTDKYNQLTLSSKSGYGLLLRAYNDGVAYRFFYTAPGPPHHHGRGGNFQLCSELPDPDSIYARLAGADRHVHVVV
jgi:alpha-glucosidase